METKTGNRLYLEGCDVIEQCKRYKYNDQTVRERKTFDKTEWISLEDHKKEIKRRSMKEITLAQFIGFHHAKQGFDIEELVSSMGLTKKEYLELINDIHDILDTNLFNEVKDIFFKK